MSATTLTASSTPREQVREWRFEQLQAAGYPQGEAFVLAGRLDVDLHVALRLIGAGCPAATAARILT